MINLLEKIREWIYQNEKRDYYQCEIIFNKDSRDLGSMIRTFDSPKNFFPGRRIIAKAFEKQIRDFILKHKLYNSKVIIKIICKVGTFKRKVIK